MRDARLASVVERCIQRFLECYVVADQHDSNILERLMKEAGFERRPLIIRQRYIFGAQFSLEQLPESRLDLTEYHNFASLDFKDFYYVK